MSHARPRRARHSAATAATTAATNPPRDSVATSPIVSMAMAATIAACTTSRRLPAASPAASAMAGTMPAARKFGSPLPPVRRDASSGRTEPPSSPTTTEATAPTTKATVRNRTYRRSPIVVMMTSRIAGAASQPKNASLPTAERRAQAMESSTHSTSTATSVSRRRCCCARTCTAALRVASAPNHVKSTMSPRSIGPKLSAGIAMSEANGTHRTTPIRRFMRTSGVKQSAAVSASPSWMLRPMTAPASAAPAIAPATMSDALGVRGTGVRDHGGSAVRTASEPDSAPSRVERAGPAARWAGDARPRR